MNTATFASVAIDFGNPNVGVPYVPYTHTTKDKLSDKPTPKFKTRGISLDVA